VEPTVRRPNDKLLAEKAEFPRRKSGRAAFDADGRSIWEWQTATGVFERNATPEQVAKLEDSNLSIVEDAEPTGVSIYGSATAAKTSASAKSTRSPVEKSTALSRLLRRFG
jgi:hypothetical protein